MKNSRLGYFSVEAAVLCASVLLLSACASVSDGIAKDGSSAETLRFPDIDKQAWIKEGTYPNLANLRKIRPGVTKNQLYNLLGSPHFQEGLMGVREWDYVFNFLKKDGSVQICQYKVLFDTDYKGQSFYWKPQSCEQLLTPPVAQKISLSAEALFAFDKSEILPKGRDRLDQLADQLAKEPDLGSVKVVGYTDRMGDERRNMNLSRDRAYAVGSYLASRGVPRDKISEMGMGSQQPVVECKNQDRDALIACLAPNRRVEIEVSGERPSDRVPTVDD